MPVTRSNRSNTGAPPPPNQRPPTLTGCRTVTFQEPAPEQELAPKQDPGYNQQPPALYPGEPPYQIWMGIQACGVDDEATAKRLAKNLFLNKFSRAFDTKEILVSRFSKAVAAMSRVDWLPV